MAKQSRRNDDERIDPEGFLRVTQREANERLEEQKRQLRNASRSSFPKGIMWGIVGIVVLFVGGFIVSFFVARHHVAKVIESNIGTLQTGLADLQHLDPQAAKEQFAMLSAPTSEQGILNVIISLFESTSGSIAAFKDLSNQLALISQDLVNIQNDIFMLPGTSENSNLVSDLTNLKTALAAIDADSSTLSGASSFWGSGSANSGLSGSNIVALKSQVQVAENFLSAVIPWLSDNNKTHHILVLLQNSSELRPGGGFLGSYADVAIASGTITSISVHDIADVDTAFKQNIVPPKPLQLEGSRFRPADGNWFFDFPTSASETLALFNESSLYANTSTTFDGVIALTPKVVTDLLSVTGPITVSVGKASTTFTSDNLVVQLQSIVQAGQAQNATYPKAVLEQLSQAIFQNLASSTSDERQQLLSLSLNWFAQKDAMVYLNDPALQSFAERYDATGDVYQLPQNFNGDYLAVPNADINSDKSELYMDEDVSFQTTLNDDGTASDHLTITRTHNGSSSPYWWYQTTNQDYLQIFVPDGSTLQNESGGITKTVYAPVNYTRLGYSTDPLIAALASSTLNIFGYPNVSTHEEDGKEVFAVWDRTYESTSTTVSFDYSHHLYAPPSNGEQYQFIFDKQSGSSANYDFVINAPIGYVFGENRLPAYEYASSTMPGRLIINLTLQKL